MAFREKGDRFLELNEDDIKMAMNEESDDEVSDEVNPLIDPHEVPLNTKRQTQWSIGVFKEWLHYRYPNDVLEDLTREILAERLTRFYQELKQDKERDYSRSAHLSIRAGINRYLTSNEVGKTFSILRDPEFKIANKSLRTKIRKLDRVVRHHSPIDAEDVKKLYVSGVFSADTPTSLLRVNFFNITLFFSIIGRHKQRALKKTNFVLKRDYGNVEYIEMEEGGPKMIASGRRDCPVEYFKKFLSVLNPENEMLFQRPKRNFQFNHKVWYENSPLGVNTLATMMREISTEAGLSRIYTSMNIKATPATTLEKAGIAVRPQALETSGARELMKTEFSLQKTNNTLTPNNKGSPLTSPSGCTLPKPDPIFLMQVSDHELQKAGHLYVLQSPSSMLQTPGGMLQTPVCILQPSDLALQSIIPTLQLPGSVLQTRGALQTTEGEMQKTGGALQTTRGALETTGGALPASSGTLPTSSVTLQASSSVLPASSGELKAPLGSTLQISDETTHTSHCTSQQLNSQFETNAKICAENVTTISRKPRKLRKNEIIRYEQKLT